MLAADNSDDNDSRANATVIDVGSTTNKTIVQGDTDWYAVDIESGKSILAELTITTENEEDLRFELFNPDGEKIGESPYDMMVPGYVTDRVAWGDSAIGGDVTEQSGTYYVRVQSVEENLSEPTNYELTVEAEELDQHDPNEEPATATQIEANDTISGALTGTDRDTHAIDPYIDREYALASEPIGWENEFTYTANTSGTHFLRVNPYIETSTIKSFEYTSSYNVSVDVSGADVDDESDSDPPTGGESENTTEDSNESTNENKNGNESTDSSPDTDDSEQTEQSDETGSDESNTMDGTDADTSDDTSTDTESSERSECGEGHTSDRSNCEEVATSSNQSD